MEIVDEDTHEPVACRIHLTNAIRKALKAPRLPFWHDHFVCDGTVSLKLPKGEYAFQVERGPEYLIVSGHFTMDDFSKDSKTVELKRFANMAKEGWWSGDLDVRRPAKDIELLMRAEDLHVVQLVAWPGGKALLAKVPLGKDPLVQFDGDRYYHLAAGNVDRPGGSLLVFNLDKPLELAAKDANYPPLSATVNAARELNEHSWIDAQQLYSWDLPVLVAQGQLDSVQLMSSNLRRKSAIDKEAPGKPRDPLLFPPPRGNGRWSEKIYFDLLNCGLHVVPTAGSGSGAVANPLGYNRMYAYVDGEFSYEKWWDAVRAGRVVVTNGPLIRPTVEGEPPGHVFRAPGGSEVELEVGLTMSTRDKVAYLEIIKNGELVQQVRLDDWAKAGGKLPLLKFNQSGWFVIRAVCDVPDTYRYAMTAPYYVEIGDSTTVMKPSAQFFLDWVRERAKQFDAEQLDIDDPDQRTELKKQYQQAETWWQKMVDRAQ